MAGWVRGRWVAVGVAATLVAGATGYAARRATSDEPASSSSRVDALAPTGMVVSVARAGFGDSRVAVGATLAFHVSVTAPEPVIAVELWAAGELAARVVDRGSTERVDRLVWSPRAPGTTTVVARAIDRRGRAGQSNGLRVVAGTPRPLATIEPFTVAGGETLADVARALGERTEVLAGLNPALAADRPLAAGTRVLRPRLASTIPVGADGAVPPDAPGDVVAALGAGRGRSRAAASLHGTARAHATGIAPLPAGLTTGDPPELSVSAHGCTATVGPTGGPPATLLALGPNASSFELVGPLPEGSAGPVAVPIGAGVSTFVAATVAGGVTAWSAPVDVTGTGDCGGWQGDTRLDRGFLVTDVPHAADRAYLYLSVDPGRWQRVPPTGFVARTPGGFDFTAHLPAIAGEEVRLFAWGRAGGALVALGSGAYTPPAADGGGPGYAGVPVTTLRWVVPDGTGALPALATTGTIDDLGVEKFVWNTTLPGVTHGVWQVTHHPVPPGAGPAPGSVLLTGAVKGAGGEFAIDLAPLAQLVAAPNAAAGGTATKPDYSQLSPVAIGTPVSPPTASPAFIDLDVGPGFDEGLGVDLYFRVVPFSGDTYLGSVSNDVVLGAPDPQTVAEAKAAQPPPPKPGDEVYDLDVTVLGAPRPADPRYMNCFQFVRWDWTEVALALKADPKLATEYPKWFAFQKYVGTGPICAACYPVSESLKFHFGGAECSGDDDLIDVFGEALVTLVNTLSSGFAYLKNVIVDAVVTLSGCKSAGADAAKVCKTIAAAALDATLLYLGIPPSLPNWDQLVAASKGELVAIAVELAKDAGIPCDAGSTAAEIHGEKNLTCEQVAAKLLDDAVKQVEQLFTDVAHSSGFFFPAGFVVRAHPAGFVGPPSVRVTVKPKNPKAKNLTGKTCTAGAITSGWWAAKPDPLGVLLGSPGKPRTVVKDVWPFTFPPYVDIPQPFFAGASFEFATWKLPDLPKQPDGTVAPASRIYYLYPPFGYEYDDVATFWQFSSSPAPKFWTKWPRQMFLLAKGATWKLTVIAGCAAGEAHTYVLPGYDPHLVPLAEAKP